MPAEKVRHGQSRNPSTPVDARRSHRVLQAELQRESHESLRALARPTQSNRVDRRRTPPEDP